MTYALNGVELNEAQCSKLITWADGHVTQTIRTRKEVN